MFTHGLCFFARTTNNVVGSLKVAVKHAHTDLHEYLCNFSRVSFIWKPILIFWVTLFISIIYLHYYIKIIIYLLVLVTLLQWFFYTGEQHVFHQFSTLHVHYSMTQITCSCYCYCFLRVSTFSNLNFLMEYEQLRQSWYEIKKYYVYKMESMPFAWTDRYR